MRREVGDLQRTFDVLVVGGGIYGACLARLAARHGYATALVERGDFGGGASHNSLKIVHGGFRYIQHLDLPRIRESVRAQRAWLAAAPHLIRPMRCVIPAYGHGTRGPEVFAAGVLAYRLAAGRRNAGLAGRNRLGASGVLSRRSMLSLCPALERADLTGGAFWHDAQMLDANRLTLECLQDAMQCGAVVMNHVEALQLRATGSKVDGIVARDRLTGREFEVRAALTINAAGPQVTAVLGSAKTPLRLPKPPAWTRNLNLVTRQLFDTQDALGVGSRRPSDAAVGKSNRLFFVTRWQDCSIVGTSHVRHEGHADDLQDAALDAGTFFAEIRDALPSLQLDAKDIRYVHAGLTPAENDVGRAKRGTIVDHARTDGVAGVVTVLGIKYTTAPTVAANVLPLIEALGPRGTARPRAWFPPLPGVSDDVPQSDAGDPGDECRSDADWARRIYGNRWAALDAMLPRSTLPEAERIFRCRVLYGIENEMVMRLSDALFRATDLVERGRITTGQVAWTAGELAARFGWDETRQREESEAFHARVRASGGSIA